MTDEPDDDEEKGSIDQAFEQITRVHRRQDIGGVLLVFVQGGLPVSELGANLTGYM